MVKLTLCALALVVASGNEIAEQKQPIDPIDSVDSSQRAKSKSRDQTCSKQRELEVIYPLFVSYRRALNTARAPSDISDFFSPNFNGYFQRRLEKAKNDEEKNRALTQYWDNLNRAQDIISVYQRQLLCRKNKRLLALVASLKSDLPGLGESITLWQVQVEYEHANQAWRINSLEFNRLKKSSQSLKVLNNFSVLSP